MIIIIICGLFFDIHLSLGGGGWGYSSFSDIRLTSGSFIRRFALATLVVVELRVFVFNEYKVRSCSKIDLKYSKIKKSCNYQCASFLFIKYLLGLDVWGSTRNSALFTCWSRLP